MDSHSIFRNAEPCTIVVQSYGEKYGIPTNCVARVSVKNKIHNPPASLRGKGTTGVSPELQRWVLENAGSELIRETADLLGYAVQEAWRKHWMAPAHVEAVWAALVLRGFALPEWVTLRVCDVLFDMHRDERADPVVVVCIGCVRGEHRSVALVEHIVKERLLSFIRAPFPYRVVAQHRELGQGGRPTQRIRQKKGGKKDRNRLKYNNNDEDDE
jgi:RNase adaptor protein for sRNA GlmZ degradation